jgi:nucleoside-diphosphate-sugar epimerase
MIFVTGATGTNGRFVVQALRETGARVRAMVQVPAKAADLERSGAELVAGDFDKPERSQRRSPASSAAYCCRRSISAWSSGRAASSRRQEKLVYVTS